MPAPIVEPVDAAPPMPPAVEPQQPQEPPAPAAEEGGGLSEDVIRIPAVQAVLVGAPPAVSMPIKGSENRDEVKTITANKDSLLAAGMGFYRSLSGEVGVMFNGLKISPEDLQAADKANKLTQIAPDFDKVNSEVAKSGRKHPLLQAEAPTASAASPRSSTIAPQAASGSLPLVPPAPASVARKLAAERAKNLQPGAPTSGPAPGAGRILNQILRPAV